MVREIDCRFVPCGCCIALGVSQQHLNPVKGWHRSAIEVRCWTIQPKAHFWKKVICLGEARVTVGLWDIILARLSPSPVQVSLLPAVEIGSDGVLMDEGVC